jgi:hypothetical protein
VELQIEIEAPVGGAYYSMHDSDLAGAVRAAEALLAQHGIDRDAAAAALGISSVTLKAYSRGIATVSHRRIPVETLDRLRDLAVEAYWRAAAFPYRVEIGGEDRAHLTPIYTAHDDAGLVRDRHPHPLRAQEVADKLGGHVRIAWAINPMINVPPLEGEAALRSRWRIGAWQLRDQFECLGRRDADAVLCKIADCCRYTLWTFSTEYRPWRTELSRSQVERLEAAIADIERGDEIQPWESGVAKAMADLEDD